MILGEEKLAQENCLEVVASFMRYTGPWTEDKGGGLYDFNFFVDWERNDEKIRIRFFETKLEYQNAEYKTISLIITSSKERFMQTWKEQLPLDGQDSARDPRFSRALNLLLVATRLAERNQNQMS